MRPLCALLLLLPWSALAGTPEEHELPPLAPDRAHELPSAPPSPLPVLGPLQAPVTVDLFQPFGATSAAANVALVLRLAREIDDLRVVYHPVPTTPMAERGTEVLWEALAQRRFWAACEWLHQRYDLLQPERETALLEEAAQLGLDAARLREALAQRRHRGRVQELWRRDREAVLPAPELWVNGRRLQHAVSEVTLRDEVERQRERAEALRREGVPLGQVYERLVQQERERPLAWARHFPGRAAPRPKPARTRPDLAMAPSLGPRVAPVVMVFFASLDTERSQGYAEIIRGVMERHPGQVRLVVKHLPSPAYAGVLAAWYLTHLQRRSPEQFWRAYHGLLQALVRRHRLDAHEIPSILRALQIDLGGIPPSPGPGPVLAQLEADRLEAKQLGVDAAPAVVVNGAVLRGGLTADSLDDLVRRELDLGLIERLRTAPER